MAYERTGRGERVFLIMGQAAGGNVWSMYQVPALKSAGYEVIKFDNRGVPPSDVPPGDYSLADLVADTAGLIEALDAEPNEALPNHGMLKVIALDEECVRLAELTARMPGICWDRLLFSAKDSVYKAWFPLTQRWLSFESADILIDPHAGTFTARLLVQGPLVNGSPLTLLNGRWLADHGLLVTTVVVPAS